MNTNKMRDISREQFEQAWCYVMRSDEDVPAARPLRSLVDPEKYRGGGVNAAWNWWKASRDALVVGLPCAKSFSASDDPWFVLEQCKDSIEHQGLKVGSHD